MALIRSTVVVAILAGCVDSAAVVSVDSRTSATAEAPMSDDQLPQAAPAFTAHFSSPVYDDPAGEFAPFGTDEGADMLDEWDERRDELSPDTTVADLLVDADMPDAAAELDTPDDGDVPRPGGRVDAATIIVGAGFTLLRLSGRIDEAGRQLTLKALDVLIRHYDSPPELLQQQADLESWAG